MKGSYDFFSYSAPFRGNKPVAERTDETLIKNNLLNPDQKEAERRDYQTTLCSCHNSPV